MDEYFEEAVQKYTVSFKKIMDEVKDEHVARTILAEAAKDHRMAVIREERRNGGEEKATPQQINYLKKLGVQVPKSLAKAKASKMIDVARALRE